MTPELGPIQPQPWWQQAATAIGMGLAAFVLAWRARGRKDQRAPFSPEKGAQPRVITRDEWHGAVQVINAWPGLSSRVRRNETRLETLEDDFREHLRIANEQAEAAAEFRGTVTAQIDQWDADRREDREHRQRLESLIRSLDGRGGGR